jgi:hypothetical protein|tara:strand:- start:556 stop:1032 length:477 start_codon:yes stop_codon:yes gene_type:complete
MSKIIQGNNPKEYEPIHSADDYVSEEDYLKAKEDWEKENYHTDKLRDSAQAQIPHEVLEETNEAGFMKLRVTQGLLEDKIVSFGKVSFKTTEDSTIKLDYTYEIEGKDKFRTVPKVEVEKMLGDFLMAMIKEQLNEKQLLFRGGEDEMKDVLKDEPES